MREGWMLHNEILFYLNIRAWGSQTRRIKGYALVSIRSVVSHKNLSKYFVREEKEYYSKNNFSHKYLKLLVYTFLKVFFRVFIEPYKQKGK